MTKSFRSGTDDNVPWIFVPLDDNSWESLYKWINRSARTKEADAALEAQAQGGILTAFAKAGLEYDVESLGVARLQTLRLLIVSHGIYMPETSFVRPPREIKRIENPLNG